MAGVEIREATASDKSAILAIGDVYDGADYLPDLFDECFINSDHTTPYVAVLNGDIVGFAAACVVDDGRTVVSRAARVKPQFSGQGIYKMLTEHLLKMSSAKVNAFTTVSTNPAVNTSSFKKSNSFILSKSFLRYDVHVSALIMPEANHLQTENLSPVNKDILHGFFTSSQHKDYLFHEDRMLVYWVPFKVLSCNIPLIWMREEHSLRISDVRLDDGVVKGLMSFSTIFRGPTGLYVYNLDLYGSDSGSLRRHILAHLDFLCDHAKGEAAIIIAGDPGLDNAKVLRQLEEFGLKELVYEPDLTVQLYEKMLTNKEGAV